MRTRRSKTIAAVTAAGIAAAAVAIPTTLIARPSDQDPDAPTKAVVAPVAAADAQTRELISILARPRVANDAIPRPAGASDPAVLDDGQPGEAYDLSRRAVPNRDADPVYVWPKEAGACFSTGSVSSCIDVDDLRDRGVQLTVSGGTAARDGVLVAGIARDGVREIEIVAGETSAKTAVVDNAFVTHTSTAPTEVRWKTPDGEHHIERFRELPREATAPQAVE